MATLLNRRRYMGGGGEKPLPPGAVYIEYLKKEHGDRLPYIMLPIEVHFPMKVKGKIKASSGGGVFPILGERAATDNRKFAWWTSNKKFALNYGSIDTGYITGTNIGDSVVEVYTTEDSIYIDDNKVMSFSANTQNIDKGVVIGGLSTNAKPDIRVGELYIYSIWIENGDGDVFDLKPIRIGQDGFLFDRISGQKFGNSGGSAFILGPDV